MGDDASAKNDETAAQADRVLEAALESSGARDPREFYRERLRTLKDSNPDAYGEAVGYYKNSLLPKVASGEGDALAHWTEYGRRLAEAVSPGRAVRIDETGLAHPYEGPELGGLIVHLPTESGARALLVGLPPELTDAQRAAYDVLVAGKQKARG